MKKLAIGIILTAALILAVPALSQGGPGSVKGWAATVPALDRWVALDWVEV